MCEQIGTALGALKVMGFIIGGIFLVLATVALVIALTLDYATESLGWLKLSLFILAAVMGTVGLVALVAGWKTRSSAGNFEIARAPVTLDQGSSVGATRHPTEALGHRASTRTLGVL